MSTVLVIKDEKSGKQIVCTNPTSIPRKGDVIDMGVNKSGFYDGVALATVDQVIWQYHPTQTDITIWVK